MGGVVLKDSLFPIGRGVWMFFTAYLLLYLCSGSINYFCGTLPKKNFIKVLFIIYTFFYFIPAFISEPFYILQQALFCYLVGAYINKYVNIKFRPIPQFLLLLSLGIIGWICSTFIHFMVISYSGKNSNTLARLLLGLNLSFFWPLIAGLLLLAFHSLPEFHNKIVNKIASAVFGVYLIHDNTLRKYLWNVLKADKSYKSQNFPFYLLIVCAGIFLICILIEIGRKKIFNNFSSICTDYKPELYLHR